LAIIKSCAVFVCRLGFIVPEKLLGFGALDLFNASTIAL
jgi:hypothetical protein